MRPTILFGALLAFAAAPSAQTFGVSASGLVTDFKPVYDGFRPDLDPLWGVGASAFAEVDLSAKLRAGMEIGYTQAGFATDALATDDDPSSLTYDASLRAHYVTVGPTLTAMIRPDGVRPYLTVGPRLDILVGQTEIVDGQRYDVDGDGGYDDLAVSAVGGLGVLVPTESRDVRAGVYVSTARPLGNQRQVTAELRIGVTI